MTGTYRENSTKMLLYDNLLNSDVSDIGNNAIYAATNVIWGPGVAPILSDGSYLSKYELKGPTKDLSLNSVAYLVPEKKKL